MGARMHRSDLPKQFLMLGNKPIIIHTVEQFVICPEIDQIVIVAPYEWMLYTEDLLAKWIPGVQDIAVICGGKNKNQSIQMLMSYVNDHYGIHDEDILVCHDAIRPFITQRIIEENISSAQKFGVVNTVVQTPDTIVESVNGSSVSNIFSISTTYSEQTPQTFNIKLLKSAIESVSDDIRTEETDTVRLMHHCGHVVRLVRGENSNMKIITPYDLEVANALLREIEHDKSGF